MIMEENLQSKIGKMVNEAVLEIEKRFKPNTQHKAFSRPLYLNGVSSDLIEAIDDSLVGTPHYMGIAYFWNYDYRHILRASSSSMRKNIHDKFIQEGLAIDLVSDLHDAVIRKYTKTVGSVR